MNNTETEVSKFFEKFLNKTNTEIKTLFNLETFQIDKKLDQSNVIYKNT